MFEITYNDSDTLQNFIDADKAYHGAIYDFTFEGRFIVYHFFVKDTARYVALDSMTGYGSEITRRRKDNLFDTRSYHSMTPMVLDSIKYTGDKRYLNVIVNNPLEAIESIFRTILPEYGFTVREDQIKLSQDMYLTDTPCKTDEPSLSTAKLTSSDISSTSTSKEPLSKIWPKN